MAIKFSDVEMVDTPFGKMPKEITGNRTVQSVMRRLSRGKGAEIPAARREYAKLKTDGGIQNVRLVTDDEVCKLLCYARTRATPAFADLYFDTLSPLSKMFNRRCCK